MFQLSKEEAERQERLKNDAEKKRRDMVTKGSSTAPSQNPLHPDTASEFSERYGGSLYQEENYNPSQSSTSNVQIGRRVASKRNKNRKKIPLLGNNSKTETEDQRSLGILQSISNSISLKQKSPSGKEKKGAVEKSLDLYGSTVGRGLIATAYIWTNFIYLTFQVWLGIIAVVAIGIVFAIEYYIGSGMTRAVFDAMMDLIGVDWDFYLVALLCYLLLITVCYVQLFGVAIQAKSLGLHPLGGKGAFVKTTTFLCCFILYWVPIFNCLPLVNLYIFAIEAYPR